MIYRWEQWKAIHAVQAHGVYVYCMFCGTSIPSKSKSNPCKACCSFHTTHHIEIGIIRLLKWSCWWVWESWWLSHSFGNSCLLYCVLYHMEKGFVGLWLCCCVLSLSLSLLLLLRVRYRSYTTSVSKAQQQFIDVWILRVSSFGPNHRPSDLNARLKTSLSSLPLKKFSFFNRHHNEVQCIALRHW